MLTGNITSSITVGGTQFTSSVSRQAEGLVSHVVDLPKGAAGAVSPAGVDGLTTGHGFVQTDVIDVHWNDPATGAHKCRRGLTVDAAAMNAVEFDETPAGEGDALPAENTAVVVSIQTLVDTDWDGDLVEMIAAKSTERAMADFRASAASVMALKQAANEAWQWVSGQETANPLAGETIDKVVLSNGSTVAGTFYLSMLYQSV